MFRKEFSLLLVISALFSGQIMAEHKGHEFVYVKNADHQLRHEADSDELRSAAGSLRRGCASTMPGRNRANRIPTLRVSCLYASAGSSSNRQG